MTGDEATTATVKPLEVVKFQVWTEATGRVQEVFADGLSLDHGTVVFFRGGQPIDLWAPGTWTRVVRG